TWTIRPLPTMLLGPGATVMMSRSAEMLALPLASALSIGRSPAGRSALAGVPGGVAAGLELALRAIAAGRLPAASSVLLERARLQAGDRAAHAHAVGALHEVDGALDVVALGGLEHGGGLGAA